MCLLWRSSYILFPDAFIAPCHEMAESTCSERKSMVKTFWKDALISRSDPERIRALMSIAGPEAV